MLALVDLWFRDLLIIKAGGDPALLLFREERETLSRIAARIRGSGILKVFDMVRETGDRLNANVNYELSIELLLLSMRSACAGKG